MPSSIGIVASQVFTPLDLSPALWLDASDTSTITASSGLVSQWNDKSSNSRNLTQSTGAYQPTTAANTVNGLNVLTFAAGKNMRTFNIPLYRNVSGATTYVVRRYTASPTAERIIFAANFVGTDPDPDKPGAPGRTLITGGNTADKASVAGRHASASTLTRVTTSANVSTSVAQIQTAWFNYAGSDMTQYVNGTVDGSTTSFGTDGTSADVDSARVSVGDGTIGANTGFAGYLCEVLVFHSAHNSEQRTTVWSYLASKWGITL